MMSSVKTKSKAFDNSMDLTEIEGLISSGEYLKAIIDLTTMANNISNTSNHMLYLYRSHCKQQLSEIEGSIKLAFDDAQEAIKLSPSSSACYFQAGIVLLAMKKFEEAEEMMKKAIQYDSSLKSLLKLDMIYIRFAACKALAYSDEESLLAAVQFDSINQCIDGLANGIRMLTVLDLINREFCQDNNKPLVVKKSLSSSSSTSSIISSNKFNLLSPKPKALKSIEEVIFKKPFVSGNPLSSVSSTVTNQKSGKDKDGEKHSSSGSRLNSQTSSLSGSVSSLAGKSSRSVKSEKQGQQGGSGSISNKKKDNHKKGSTGHDNKHGHGSHVHKQSNNQLIDFSSLESTSSGTISGFNFVLPTSSSSATDHSKEHSKSKTNTLIDISDSSSSKSQSKSEVKREARREKNKQDNGIEDWTDFLDGNVPTEEVKELPLSSKEAAAPFVSYSYSNDLDWSSNETNIDLQDCSSFPSLVKASGSNRSSKNDSRSSFNSRVRFESQDNDGHKSRHESSDSESANSQSTLKSQDINRDRNGNEKSGSNRGRPSGEHKTSKYSRNSTSSSGFVERTHRPRDVTRRDNQRQSRRFSEENPSSSKAFSLPSSSSSSKGRPTNLLKLNGIWIGRLNKNVKESTLKSLFSAYGKVLQCRRPATYAFVHYDNPISPAEAMFKWDGVHHDDISENRTSVLKIKFVPSREQMKAYNSVPKSYYFQTVKKSGECPDWRADGQCKYDNCVYQHLPANQDVDSLPDERKASWTR